MSIKLLNLVWRKNWVGRFVAILFTVLGSFAVMADNLQVAASWSKPPYIIPQTHSGFELELVTDVLNELGHKVDFVYMPYNQVIEMLADKQTDVALTLNSTSSIAPEYLSDVYVAYQNVALSLKDKNLPIQRIQELSKYRVIGFQSAADVLGDEFANAIKHNALYIEIADQKRQLELLFNGQTDVIIIDLNIFHHLSMALTGSAQLGNVTIHPFFAPNHYAAGFKNIRLKESFNQALGKYRSSGRYEALKVKYNFQDIHPIPIIESSPSSNP